MPLKQSQSRALNTELRSELFRLGKIDEQLFRLRVGRKWDKRIYQKNVNDFKKLIKQHGWPHISLVGKRAAKEAWFLSQHADIDKKFQEQCLKLMRQSAQRNEAEKKYFAYLTDRIRVNKKQQQLYGTQWFEIHKEMKVLPIAKIKTLDERRKAVNLPRFTKHERSSVAQEFPKNFKP